MTPKKHNKSLETNIKISQISNLSQKELKMNIKDSQWAKRGHRQLNKNQENNVLKHLEYQQKLEIKRELNKILELKNTITKLKIHVGFNNTFD